MSSGFKFGISSVNITPPVPVRLQGQFYERVATEIESPLTVNAFAVESGREHFIICSCDLIGIDTKVVANVRKLLSGRCPDFIAEHLIICATHTHSAPECVHMPADMAIGGRFLPKDKKYKSQVTVDKIWAREQTMEFLSDKIAQAVYAAWESRRPGQYMPAFGRAVIGHCRRVVYSDGSAQMYGLTSHDDFVRMESGNDTGVEMLYLFSEDGELKGAIVNIACPAQVLEHGPYISSDFWGKARSLLKDEFGQEFVLVGLCSAAGCQSPRDIVRDIARPESVVLDAVNASKRRQDSSIMWTVEGTKELGRRIRNVVVECLPDKTQDLKREAQVACQKKVIDLPLRRVSKRDYKQAYGSYMDKVRNSKKDVFMWEDIMRLHSEGGIMQRYKEQQKHDSLPVEMVAAKIDDMAFISNPFEMYLDYGNRIKGRSPAAQTLVIQLANGYMAYLPTEQAEQGEHYSAYIASSVIGHEGGQMLVEESLKVLDKLF